MSHIIYGHWRYRHYFENKVKVLSALALLFIYAFAVSCKAPGTAVPKAIGQLRETATVSLVWNPDNGDGTYRNPVINADYSDPDVIQVDGTYYLTASSFSCVPGLPILESKDLVNWKFAGYALPHGLPEQVYDRPQHGKGVWAPSLRYHNKEFYIYWGDPDYGIYMVKSSTVKGPWSNPVLVLAGKGLIDPCPIWDDGRAYLVHAWAYSRAGVNSLLTLHTMKPDGTSVLDYGKNIYDGHGANHTIEGPKIYKRGGYYYIFAPAGGVENGWQLVLRSRTIYGPYEEKVVLEQGKTTVNGPHQGAWIDSPQGQSWFMHFQDRGVYGRVVHLQPLKWSNNWPAIGIDNDGNGIGEPVETHATPMMKGSPVPSNPQENDEFNDGGFGLQWQWSANTAPTWYAGIAGTDYLRLFALADKESWNLYNVPSLLLQKLPAADFTATTRISLTSEWEAPGKTAGLLIMGGSYAYIGITSNGKGFSVKQVRCKNAAAGTSEEVLAEKALGAAHVYFRVRVEGPGGLCHFSYSEDGIHFTVFGEAFQAEKDLWIGAKIGLFCTSEPQVRGGGYADFHWFRIDDTTKMEK